MFLVCYEKTILSLLWENEEHYRDGYSRTLNLLKALMSERLELLSVIQIRTQNAAGILYKYLDWVVTLHSSDICGILYKYLEWEILGEASVSHQVPAINCRNPL